MTKTRALRPLAGLWERFCTDPKTPEIRPVEDFPDLVAALRNPWASRMRVLTLVCADCSHAVVRVYDTGERHVAVFQQMRRDIDAHYEGFTLSSEHRGLTFAAVVEDSSRSFRAECRCREFDVPQALVQEGLRSGRRRVVIVEGPARHSAQIGCAPVAPGH